jgi:hypothetical protein
MSCDRGGRVGSSCLAVLQGLMAAALLVPALAAAHLPPTCPETWNPSQEPDKFTGVPGGWSTAPGTTDKSTPQNPDGFFKLNSSDGHDLVIYNGCPGFGGTDDGNGDGEPIVQVDDGATVKFTEANGKDPGWKLMAGTKPGNPSSDYIYLHVWAQGDMWVCDVMDSSACTCCWVPPPPFTCEGTPFDDPVQCPDAE